MTGERRGYILDSRVITKGYGKTVLSSLPDSPVISTLGEVKEFFVMTDANLQIPWCRTHLIR